MLLWLKRMVDSQSALGDKGADRDSQTISYRFNDFPAEIRSLIWEHAIPDDVSEVHILRPSSIRPHAFPTVDMAFPAAMHVSQEARESCMRRLRMRHCPDFNGLKVPCRDFRPELDVMFIGVFNFYAFFSKPEFFYGGMVRKLKHIAVDIVLATSAARIAHVLQYLDSLETVSVVFARPGDSHMSGEALPQGGSQIRRCRMRPFTTVEQATTSVGDRPRPRDYQPVATYLSDIRREIEHITKQLLPTLDDGVMVGTWDYEKRKLKPQLKINAQAFEEYVEGEWQVRQRQQMRILT